VLATEPTEIPGSGFTVTAWLALAEQPLKPSVTTTDRVVVVVIGPIVELVELVDHRYVKTELPPVPLVAVAKRVTDVPLQTTAEGDALMCATGLVLTVTFNVVAETALPQLLYGSTETVPTPDPPQLTVIEVFGVLNVVLLLSLIKPPVTVQIYPVAVETAGIE